MYLKIKCEISNAQIESAETRAGKCEKRFHIESIKMLNGKYKFMINIKKLD